MCNLRDCVREDYHADRECRRMNDDHERHLDNLVDAICDDELSYEELDALYLAEESNLS